METKKIGKSYNEQKKACFELLESLIKKDTQESNGSDKLRLIYELTKLFAVGEFTINKRINLLINIGLVKEDEGVLIWKDTTE